MWENWNTDKTTVTFENDMQGWHTYKACAGVDAMFDAWEAEGGPSPSIVDMFYAAASSIYHMPIEAVVERGKQWAHDSLVATIGLHPLIDEAWTADSEGNIIEAMRCLAALAEELLEDRCKLHPTDPACTCAMLPTSA